jgi:hypothetical protein
MPKRFGIVAPGFGVDLTRLHGLGKQRLGF